MIMNYSQALTILYMKYIYRTFAVCVGGSEK